jgi:transposase
LARVELTPAVRARVNSALRLIDNLDFEVELFTTLTGNRLREDPGYQAIQQIPGIGAVLGAVFVAEIGDIGRFPGPAQLASWAGLTPRHHESDTTVHRGRITKMGCGGRSRGLRFPRVVQSARRSSCQSWVGSIFIELS